jgi:arabinogalactan oligomer / maltooligosaccharide transport system substrate-binding protein
MKKSTFALLAILVVASLLIGACGATPQPTPPAAQPEPAQPEPAQPEPEASLSGNIVLWHSWKESEIPGLNAVIAGFQEQYPDVTFEVLYTPHEDLRGKFETAAATGGGPAVLLGSADWGPALYDAGLVTDVSSMASDDFLATINPAALAPLEYKGALVGLPHTIKGVVMFRNPAIIADAPATWDDLVAAAQEATAGDVVGADLEAGLFFAAGHLTGIGGQLMDEDGDPAFNDEKGVEWMNLIKSFQDAGPVEYNNDNDVNLYKAGKAGIIIDGTWNIAGFVETMGAENVAIDPWPAYGDGALSGYVQTDNIYLGSNVEGDDQAAAWAFMEYFLSPEAQTMLGDVAHIPATLDVEVTDPHLQQAAVAFEGGTAFPVIPEMGAYWGPFDNAIQSVLNEGTDPAAALQEAYDAIVPAVEEIRGGQ